MILSEFAFLCGEDDKSILNRELNPHLSAEYLCSVPMQAGCLVHWLLTRPALPPECSHLLMDAVISLGSQKFHSLIWTFWPYYSSGADCSRPMFTDTECFINALSNKWMGEAENLLSIKPWFILQTKYLSSERIHCAKIHRALTPGTVALGESYASYHSPRITDYTKVPHTTICIISGHCQWAAPWHAIKVDTDECIYIGRGQDESVKNQNIDGRL